MNCCHLSLYGIPELKTETVHLGVPSVVLHDFLGTLRRAGRGVHAYTPNAVKPQPYSPPFSVTMRSLLIQCHEAGAVQSFGILFST